MMLLKFKRMLTPKYSKQNEIPKQPEEGSYMQVKGVEFELKISWGTG